MTAASDRLNTALAGRYRIERELGTGGMATVYLAADLKHDRKVAIKVLKPELAAVLGAERFVVEIKTTAALSHPHILPLFDSGTADGFLFYVMPFIEGETIRDKLNRETQFGVDDAVRIAREVADALDYAHRHGIIHRDIKPENILLHDGRAMVMDFGIALAVSAAAGGRMTETGLSLGTPHYMSPEQATAEKEITPRSDVYSLASVMYEMLAGEPPHTGGSAQQIIMKIITEQAAPVTNLRKSAPPNVASALVKALEKLPADRFANAKEFADALGNTAFATHATAAIRGPHALGAGIPRSTLIAGAVAALAVITAIWSMQRGSTSHLVTRVGVMLPDSQQLGDGNSRWRVAISPDGRTIAYVGGKAGTLDGPIWIRKLDELRATPLAGTEGAMNPSFSPDGKRIVYMNVATKRSLRVIPVSGGPYVQLTDSLVDLGGISWGYDGYIYFDGKLKGDGLARVRETGGSPEVASMPDTSRFELWHFNPSVLPNGRGVIFTAAQGTDPEANDVAVLDTKTGKHTILEHGVFGRYSPSGHLIFVTATGTMMAVPFDASTLRTSGVPVAISADVAVHELTHADLVMSNTGTLVYVAGNGIGVNEEFVWLRRDGTAGAVDSTFTGQLGTPVLSPDGHAVAVARFDGNAQGVFVKQLDRGPAAKVADSAGSPNWSADGRTLFIVTSGGIARVPADGSRHPEVMVRPAGGVGALSVSRDGKWAAFTNSGGLFAVALGDSTVRPKRLVEDGSFPSFSPDGQWLAYSSQGSGRWETYVVPFPDVSLARHQVTPIGGLYPRWSPDGRELFFKDDGLRRTWVVPVAPGPTFVAGTPREFTPLAGYSPGIALAADGRVLALRTAGVRAQHADELILVENFGEELTAKVKKK